MRSNFIIQSQSRDKNQIRANFGYKRIGEKSNPYPRREINLKEHTHNKDVNSFSCVLSDPLTDHQGERHVLESRHGRTGHSSVGYEPKTKNLLNERHCEGNTHSCATIFESIRLSNNPRIGETDTSFGCQ